VALGRDRAIHIRFIEYMPFRENSWSRDGLVPYQEMLGKIGRVLGLTAVGHGERTGGVAKDFRVEGYKGRVSFITPVSDTFCDRCNRLRVTASGHIKTCLFGAAGADLAGAVEGGASDEELAGLILQSLAGKPERHPEADRLCDGQDRAMNQIGG
jgi:molybdenum cofactor biosynthesis enzyme MoaA